MTRKLLSARGTRSELRLFVHAPAGGVEVLPFGAPSARGGLRSAPTLLLPVAWNDIQSGRPRRFPRSSSAISPALATRMPAATRLPRCCCCLACAWRRPSDAPSSRRLLRCEQTAQRRHLLVDAQGLLHPVPVELDVADREAAAVDGLARSQGTGKRPPLVPQHLQVVDQAEPVAPDPVEPLAATGLLAATAEDGQHAHRFAIGAALLLRC